MKQGLAALTAQIAANNRIQQTRPRFLDIGNAADSFYKGQDFATRQKMLADKMAENESNNQYLENFRTAVEGGDQTAIDKAYAQYDPSGYARNQFLLQKLNAQGNEAKGEFGYLLNNAGLAQNERELLSKQRLQTLAKGFDTVYGQAQAQAMGKGAGELEYARPLAEQKSYGKEAGKGLFAEQMNVEESQSRSNAIDSVIGEIKNSPELVTRYAPYQQAMSEFSGGSLGFSKEQLQKRGEIVRSIGQIQNDLLQKARAAGQTGINTMAEIKQATKGLDENSSADTLVGALSAMKEADNRLNQRLLEKNRGNVPQVAQYETQNQHQSQPIKVGGFTIEVE